jgi:hypothetical protein
MNKRNEPILAFDRLKDVIPVDTLIDLLLKSKQECEEKGYTNLTLWLHQDSSRSSIRIYGDRDLTEEEKDAIERMEVITREKDKTSKGLSREDLLKY